MAHPVSVQVCTLNEEANIGPCLDQILTNDPEDVVVIDGGSTDRTVGIARGRGIRVIEAGPVGLAAQRRIGYQTSPSAYTAFVDADDRLEPRWIPTMLAELQAGGYSALQSLLRVPSSECWWSAAWNRYFVSAVTPQADTIMVGRPSLFNTRALLALPEPSGAIVEDTEMSRQFALKGMRMGIGTAISFRICPTTKEENFRKWRGYGRGYQQFVQQFPERRTAILKHMAVTVPVSRTLPSVAQGHISQPVFGFMMSVNMIIGWMQESLQGH